MYLLMMGAAIMLGALGVILAMVVGVIAPGIIVAFAAYAGLFAGMAVAAGGAVQHRRRSPPT